MIRAIPIAVAWVLLWSAPFLPASTTGYHTVLAKLKASGGGGGGYTVLASADFEETGTPSGWTLNGSADADYTTSPAPLSGTESLHVFTSTTQRVDTPVLGTSEPGVWVYFVANFPSSPSVNGTIFQFRVSNSSQGTLTHRTDDVLRIANGGGTSADTTTTVGGGTWHIKMKYVASTGSDGICELWLDADGDFSAGAEHITANSHTNTSETDELRWQGSANGSTIIDDVLWTDADPGDTPTLPYLLEEDFEGTGLPTGWTTTHGTPDYDYATSPAPLEGTKSMFLDGASNNGTRSVSVPEHSNMYAYFRLVVGAASGNVEFAFFEDSGNTARCKMEYRSGGGIRVEHGTANGTTGSVLTTGTLYHVWMEYEKGTGADGVARLYYSTSSTKPGSPESTLSTGTSTAKVDKIRFFQLPNDVIIDDVKISDSPIGSAP